MLGMIFIGKPVPTFPDHAGHETFKLKLLRWRRRVLPPGLPAVHSEFQRHRLATGGPYAGLRAKDRVGRLWRLTGFQRLGVVERQA
jgi:hypothetical protein